MLHVATYLLFIIYVLPVLIVILFSFAPASSIGIETNPFDLDTQKLHPCLVRWQRVLPVP